MKTKKTSIPNNIIVTIYITIDKFGTALLCPPILYLFDQKYRNIFFAKSYSNKKKNSFLFQYNLICNLFQ